jgi:RHS repeat-associated protein
LRRSRPPPSRPRAADDRGPADDSARLRRHPGFADRSRHNVIHELDSERGLISWQWEPESFTPIAKEHNGRRWTIASDHLGTPTEMYDDLGQLAWKMQLDVFGLPRFEAGSAEDCPWRWPGQYQSADYPEHYARARHYDPQGGRFISGDPLGLIAGPRTHGYPQNPVLQTDPLGLAPVDALFEHNGTVFADVNPTRRSPRVDAPIVGPPNQPGLSAINNNVFGAHAEIGAMNQSLAAGNRGGLGVLMVQGEPICRFCQSDIKKMALSLGLDELHIHHLDTGELAVLRTADFATVDNGGVTLRSRMPKSCS